MGASYGYYLRQMDMWPSIGKRQTCCDVPAGRKRYFACAQLFLRHKIAARQNVQASQFFIE